MLNIKDHDRVRTIGLERPPVNAINPELAEELTKAIKAAPEHADALVIHGREGMFSAGLDVPELVPLDRPSMFAFWTSFFGLLEAAARSPIPVAAAITGHAPAGGAVLALFCDCLLYTSDAADE